MQLLLDMPFDTGEVHDAFTHLGQRKFQLTVTGEMSGYRITFSKVAAYRITFLPVFVSGGDLLRLIELDDFSWSGDLAISGRMPQVIETETPLRFYALCMPDGPRYEIIARSCEIEQFDIEIQHPV